MSSPEQAKALPVHFQIFCLSEPKVCSWFRGGFNRLTKEILFQLPMKCWNEKRSFHPVWGTVVLLSRLRLLKRRWEQMRIWWSWPVMAEVRTSCPGIRDWQACELEEALWTHSLRGSLRRDLGTGFPSLKKGREETARCGPGQTPTPRDCRGDRKTKPKQICKSRPLSRTSWGPAGCRFILCCESQWFAEKACDLPEAGGARPSWLSCGGDALIELFRKTGFNWTLCGAGCRGEEDEHTPEWWMLQPRWEPTCPGGRAVREGLGWVREKTSYWRLARGQPVWRRLFAFRLLDHVLQAEIISSNLDFENWHSPTIDACASITQAD